MSSRIVHKYTDSQTGVKASVTVTVDGQEPKIRQYMTELEEAALKLAMNFARNDFRKAVPNKEPYSKEAEQVKAINNATTFRVVTKDRMANLGFRSKDRGTKAYYARFVNKQKRNGGVLYAHVQAITPQLAEIMKNAIAGMNSYQEIEKVKAEGAAIPNEPN